MPGPEAEIERALRKEAIAAGWKVRKLAFLDANGAPDRAFGKDGRTILIEVKAPGEKPTRQQYRRHEELRDFYGWEVRWIDNLRDGRRILKLRGG